MSAGQELVQEVSTRSTRRLNRNSMLVTIDQGSGHPALIFLHNFGGSSREWIEVITELSQEYRCLAIDTDGFGQAVGQTGFTVEAMTAGVEALINEYDFSECVVVGHSMTGKVALALAALAPDWLEALVLVTPSPPGPEPIKDESRDEMRARDRSSLNAERMIQKTVGCSLSPELLNRAIEDHLQSSPAAWSAWLESGSYEDWSERVGVLTIPALLITGEKDPALPLSIQQRLTLPHVPGAEMVEVPGCGHLLPLEAASELVAIVGSFMARLCANDSV